MKNKNEDYFDFAVKLITATAILYAFAIGLAIGVSL